MKRREVLGLGMAGTLAALIGGLPEPAEAGVALKVLKNEGMVAVPLTGGACSAVSQGVMGTVVSGSAALDGANLASDLVRDLYPTCIGRGRASAATKIIQPLYQALLERQVAAGSVAVAGMPANVGVSTAVIVADVYAPDILKGEALTATLVLGGKTYSGKLTKHKNKDVGHGFTIVVSHTAAPSDADLNGSLFVALVRLVQFPDRGLLVLGVLDTELNANLASDGITNINAAGEDVAIAYSLNLSGGASGNHRANDKSFAGLYYSRADGFGVLAPADLADEAQAFLADVVGP